MSGTRTRLINAVRRTMIQRASLQRKIGSARAALKPKALVDRGKFQLSARIDETVQAARTELRENRLPIALAALAGLAWYFREPIKNHVPRAAHRLREIIDAGVEKIRTGAHPEPDDDEMENDDEAVQ